MPMSEKKEVKADALPLITSVQRAIFAFLAPESKWITFILLLILASALCLGMNMLVAYSVL